MAPRKVKKIFDLMTLSMVRCNDFKLIHWSLIQKIHLHKRTWNRKKTTSD